MWGQRPSLGEAGTHPSTQLWLAVDICLNIYKLQISFERYPVSPFEWESMGQFLIPFTFRAFHKRAGLSTALLQLLLFQPISVEVYLLLIECKNNSNEVCSIYKPLKSYYFAVVELWNLGFTFKDPYSAFMGIAIRSLVFKVN